MVNFAPLHIALTGLQSQLAALNTIGHNIANASTPGYSRQRVELETELPTERGGQLLGNGVRVADVVRLVDEAVESRLRDATSALGEEQVTGESLVKIEAAFNELTDTDLSSTLSKFFDSLEDFASNPENLTARRAVVSQAETLADAFRDLEGKISDVRKSLDEEVVADVDRINGLTEGIAALNEEIQKAENGGADNGRANDLRDRRGLLVQQLSEIVQIRTVEMSNGELNVFAGNQYLVLGDEAKTLETDVDTDRGIEIHTPRFTESGAEMELLGGRLAGAVEGRDVTLVEMYDTLNDIAHTTIYEFNRIQSQGRGLEGLSDVTSERAVTAPNPLFPLAVDGSVAAGVTSTSFIDTGMTSAVVGFPAGTTPVGMQILVLDGDNKNQMRTITGYDANNGTIQFDREFSFDLQVGDRYQITTLPFEMKHGSFDVVVTNELTGQEQSFNIPVNLDRLPAPPGTMDDDTLATVQAAIDAIGNITATIDAQGRLRIQSDTSDVTFHFANDTSGFLAAIGLNTFFSGTGAEDMGVNGEIVDDPSLLAGARSNVPGDNSNALAMAALRDTLVASEGDQTIEEAYRSLVADIAVRTRASKDALANRKALAEQVQNQRDRISGVNIDEEAVQMISYQRAFQATARFLGVVDNILDTLINQI